MEASFALTAGRTHEALRSDILLASLQCQQALVWGCLVMEVILTRSWVHMIPCNTANRSAGLLGRPPGLSGQLLSAGMGGIPRSLAELVQYSFVILYGSRAG